MDDIASIVVKIDQSFTQLKSEIRPSNPDLDKITDLILEMRWDLSRALTSIGKSDAGQN